MENNKKTGTELLLDLFSDFVHSEKLFWKITGVWYCYEKWNITKFTVDFIDEYDDEENTKYISVEKVLGKNFWFIKWLIKHYYIELPMWFWQIHWVNEDWTFAYRSDEESLLMLLAISDDPIEFLLRLIDK